MFEEMESSFLRLPALDVVAGRFRVVLQNNPIFRVDDPKWPQLVRALPISLTQKRAIAALVDREFSNADYCELNAVDRDTAYRELHDLVDRGLVQETGSGAGTLYRVVRESVAASAPSTAPPMERLAARMAEAGFITNTDYRDAFDVDRNTAKAALASLVGAGVLIREGNRRSARYRRGDRWPSV
jgi:predicted HTH transcriptional regulator